MYTTYRLSRGDTDYNGNNDDRPFDLWDMEHSIQERQDGELDERSANVVENAVDVEIQQKAIERRKCRELSLLSQVVVIDAIYGVSEACPQERLDSHPLDISV